MKRWKNKSKDEIHEGKEEDGEDNTGKRVREKKWIFFYFWCEMLFELHLMESGYMLRYSWLVSIEMIRYAVSNVIVEASMRLDLMGQELLF